MFSKEFFATPHIVVDLETTSTKPNARVLTIGASCVKLHNSTASTSSNFYARINPVCPQQNHRDVDVQAMLWWGKQNEVARNEAFGLTLERKVTSQALNLFAEFIRDTASIYEMPPFLWGNAASFDLSVLKSLYEDTLFSVPWTYRQEMDLCTLRAMFPTLEYKSAEGTTHVAVNDAQDEAITLSRILYHLRNQDEIQHSYENPETIQNFEGDSRE